MCSQSESYVCETKVIEGKPYCVDDSRNYAVLAKDTQGLNNPPKADDSVMNIAEMVLFNDGTPLSTVSYNASSSHGAASGVTKLDDGNENSHWHSKFQELIDTNPFVVLDVGNQNFDLINITNRVSLEYRINGATLKVYHRDTLLQNWTLHDSLLRYSIDNWNGGECCFISLFLIPFVSLVRPCSNLRKSETHLLISLLSIQ